MAAPDTPSALTETELPEVALTLPPDCSAAVTEAVELDTTLPKTVLHEHHRLGGDGHAGDGVGGRAGWRC